MYKLCSIGKNPLTLKVMKSIQSIPIKIVAPLLVAVVLAILPVPPDLKPNAWYYFALFAGVIVALVLEPLPASAVGLVGVTAIAVMGRVTLFDAKQLADPNFKLPAETLKWALSGFGSSTLWLVFGAFMFGVGYEKTGLGRRIALALVKALGSKTLGLGYAITLSDLILAPFTASNTARSGGTIFPIIRNIPGLYGSQPGETARKIGSYIMWTAFAATCITSSMFVTSLAPNVLALDLVKKTAQVEISWLQWLWGFLPVGVILLAILPLLIYKLYPPEIKSSQEVPVWAGQELRKMGKVTWQEVAMAALVILALALWIFGSSLVDTTTVTLIVISMMLVTGIVRWDDILNNQPAWNVLIWVATLITLADGLNKVGFVTWLAQGAAALLAGRPPMVVMVILVMVFYVVHYMFASVTAHTTAVLPVMLAAGMAVPGLPVRVFALLLVYSLGLMGVITPYATGPAPVYFGSGYIPRKDYWSLGAAFGLIFLVTLLVVGAPYLMAIYP
jgi:L-tartrate/succinate antiporter